MNRIGKVAWFAHGFVPLMDAPDAVGGGGGADPDDAGDGSQPSEDSVDVDNNPEGSGATAPNSNGDDDAIEDLLIDDEEDDDQAQRSPEERIKKLATKNRKLRRRLAKAAPALDRIKGLDLDALISRAKTAEQLEAQLQRNPRLRALINGEDEPEPASRRTARTPDPEDADFDPSELPFDENENDVNRYFGKLARKNHELSRELRKVKADLTDIRSTDTKRVEQTEQQEWISAISAAAKQIEDETTRILFKDAMVAAFKSRRDHGRTPQQIIQHYLKGKVSPQTEKRAAAAAAGGAKPGATARAATQQRIAQQTTSQTTRTFAANGSPAPAKKTRETIADVNRRIRNLGQ